MIYAGLLFLLFGTWLSAHAISDVNVITGAALIVGGLIVMTGAEIVKALEKLIE